MKPLRLALVALMLTGGADAAVRKTVPPEIRKVAPLALDHFYRDLARLEAGEIVHLRIVQLGDSHTAGDVFSGRLRSRLQERFGASGRGAMPPGKTYPGIRQKEVSLSQSGPWTMRNSKLGMVDQAFGLSGFVAISGAAGATMQVTPTEDRTFHRARIEFLHAVDGPGMEILLDGAVVETVVTEGPDGQPGFVEVAAEDGARSLGLVAQGPNLLVKSWSLLRREPGIVVESFGIIGATVRVMERWSETSVAADVAALPPSLVLLAFGTNEGFEINLDPRDYTQAFTVALGRLTRWAPQASLLVVGPPDGQRTAGPCQEPKGGKPAKAGRKAPPCRWFTPANLPIVRGVQRRVAAEAGIAFWDWSSVMAEPGGISRWVAANPPLARADHIHFTLSGYELAADALYEQLMDGYTQYRRKHPVLK
jgi:lysophospholipase L1-like esterase